MFSKNCRLWTKHWQATSSMGVELGLLLAESACLQRVANLCLSEKTNKNMKVNNTICMVEQTKQQRCSKFWLGRQKSFGSLCLVRLFYLLVVFGCLT